MNVFEDAGYFCVDNLPAEMIRSLVGAVHARGLQGRARRRRVRLARRRVPGRAGRRDRPARGGRASCTASSSSPPTRRRCSPATRRPAGATRSRPHGSVVDGIRAEQELLAPVRERADIVIDTSGLSAAALRRKVADELLEPATPGRLAVTFTSLRPQARPAARRRPRVRRPLPAQPALRARPAPADRVRPADRRLRRPRRAPGGVLRAR